jgi:hypothetical protein
MQIIVVPAFLATMMGASGPIDDVPGATGGWSTRKLYSAYSGSCLKVRRSSDSTEADIGFVGANLDTASLLTFVGANDGFVRTWYDQSGNGRHFNQATATNQPKIVNAGALITTIGGQPSIDFDGVDNFMITTDPASTFLTVSAGTVLTIFNVDAISTNAAIAYDDDAMWANVTSQVGAHFNSATPSVRSINQDAGAVDHAANTIATDTSYLHIWCHRAGNIESYISSTPTTAASGNTSSLGTALRLGRNYDASGQWYDGALAEIICYDTALSSGDIATLAAAMVAPYGISWS